MAITYLCDNLPQSDTLIAVGAPLRKDGMLFNTALIFKGNELLGIVPKTFVPNYKEFYEKRWFAGADQRFSDTIRYDEIFYDEGASLNGERTFPFTPNLIIEGRNGIRLACEICEDLWVNIPPSSFHASAGANVIANLSASNDVVTKPEYRIDLVRMQSGTNMCAYVYCSSGSGESTTDLIFSGHNIIAANGTILADSNKEATEALIDLERINNDRIKNNSISYAAARYSQMASNGKTSYADKQRSTLARIIKSISICSIRGRTCRKMQRDHAPSGDRSCRASDKDWHPQVCNRCIRWS